MSARSLLVVGLFFQMTIALNAQYMQQQPPNHLQQQQMLRKMQRQQGMMQGMQGMQGMQQGVAFEATGTIEAIGGGRIKMIDDKGTERMILFNQQTVVKTTGEATAEFLKPGLCVEFKTEVDAKGNAPGKIEELSIVSHSKDRPMGVFAEGGEESAEPAAQAAPPTAKAAAKPAARSASGTRAKKSAAAATPAVMSKVVGNVKSVKNSKMLVQAGRTSVQCELGVNPKISLEMADGNFAAKGDKIEVKGLAMANMPNQGHAQSITITLAEPLGLAKKKIEPPKGESRLPKPTAKKSRVGGQ